MSFRLPRWMFTFVFALGVAVSACTTPTEVPVGPDGQRDQALVTGQGVYSARCQSCHGARGGGGRGPNITTDNVVTKYPNIADQIAIVTGGKDEMPRFGGELSADEIEAVVRYTREVLGK